MPKTWEPKLLQSEAANKRADLEMILRDLEHVAACCDAVIARGKHPLTDLEAAALFDSIAIRYRRCFASGVRTRLDQNAYPSLQGDAADVHSFLQHLANKHIAHSVNDFEMNASVVYVAHDEQGQIYRGGIGSCGHGTLELSLNDIGKFGDLARNTIEDVKAHHESLTKQVMHEIEAMTEDQLRVLPEGFTPPEFHVDHRRKWPMRTVSPKIE